MLFNTFVVAALASLAAATPTRRNEPAPADSCSTGSLQCCNSAQSADSKDVTALLGLLGIVVGTVQGLVGVTCSPISVIGGGGAGCNAEAVCCDNNNFNGLVALGCTPINLNL